MTTYAEEGIEESHAYLPSLFGPTKTTPGTSFFSSILLDYSFLWLQSFKSVQWSAL